MSFKLLELFSGYGSQALALENLGIEFTSEISEIDKYAIQAYMQLNGETKNYGDITQIERLDYADLWTYSFPCQDLSVAGKQAGISQGTRSGLLYEVERLLRKSVEYGNQPKYLLLENVKNLVGKKFKPEFDKWLQTLDSLGYNNYWKVLNAKDYGVPQNRERVFVVSIRKDIDTKGYKFPSPVPLQKRLKDVLEPCVDEKYYLSDDLIGKLSAKIQKVVCGGRGSLDKNHSWDIVAEPICIGGMQANQSVKIDGVSTCLTSSMGTGGGYVPMVTEPLCADDTQGFDGVRYYDNYSPTLRSERSGLKVVEPKITEGYRIRKLTPRECWRLMGVKDEQFDRLHGISNSQLYKLAGNSIVVDVLEAIFRNLLMPETTA